MPDGYLADAFTDNRQALVRYLSSLTRDSAAAEDLAQEAFLRLARETAQGRAPDSAAAWLFRVGRNLATSRARHASVAGRHAHALAPMAASDAPEAIAIRMERAKAVRAAMVGLPAEHREALLLAAEGHPGSVIAARLDRTPLATRALLCRARRRLRSRLLEAGLEP